MGARDVAEVVAPIRQEVQHHVMVVILFATVVVVAVVLATLPQMEQLVVVAVDSVSVLVEVDALAQTKVLPSVMLVKVLVEKVVQIMPRVGVRCIVKVDAELLVDKVLADTFVMVYAKEVAVPCVVAQIVRVLAMAHVKTIVAVVVVIVIVARVVAMDVLGAVAIAQACAKGVVMMS